MRIEFLGTGGAIPIPRPGSQQRVSMEARKKGVPYSRTGPSVFVHGPNLLIDTPEESHIQLNRANISFVENGVYSHWHPDHVMGRRVWEMLNGDFREHPTKERVSDVYFPKQVAEDMKKMLGSWDHFTFLQSFGTIRMHVLEDEESFTLHDVVVTPIQLHEKYVYGFLLEEESKRVFIAPDELYGWEPPANLNGVDIVILPMGIHEEDKNTGEQRFSREFLEHVREASFQDTLNIIKKLQAKKVILTHIEEIDNLGYDDLKELEGELQDAGLPVTFAYDTMIIDV
ncbi:MBL fold metallo-hydrolase [Priestia taiwanensis]|uniref:Metallo-hydrolase/oxidoreductase n=1 Tax=Priestia taiwanensis TaxID=1347902 RepID=A0A917AQH1_9BACI|nr:MBL fold metallo-hydrolase [Priestia taiwanensis]MBM7362525.1 phosphoribosyl 1,2-cyclic phosphate phosphodiesterase [Priestia taiwanensis]GGE62915.1 metallo-hydrolase/oxidoreductase [Priestia taiwanensis]